MSYEDYLRQLEETTIDDERTERLRLQEANYPSRLHVADDATRRLLALAGQGGSY